MTQGRCQMSAISENSATLADAPTSESVGVALLARIGEGEVVIAGRRYIRQQRLAALLDVSERTLARWDARRIGPPKITIGKTVLFDVAKLPDWLASRETQPIRNARR